MANANTIRLVLDTSYLRGVGLGNPDFQKLLRLSKEGLIKVLIPYVVWEEWRTQMLDKIQERVRCLRKDVEALKRPWIKGLEIDGLTPPIISVWTDIEIETRSKAAMAKFAAEHKIEVLPFASDHTDRAWARYFRTDPPYNLEEKDREKRRKDIPDAWTFETVIDLKKSHDELFSLCRDGRLSSAMKEIGVEVLEETQQILDLVDARAVAKAVPEPIEGPEAEVGLAVTLPEDTEGKLAALLAPDRERLDALETRILGYVGYLRSPSKDQLFGLLSRSGVSVETARNIAERLTIAGLITDTGNHYIPANKDVCDFAAAVVEPEVIELLKS